jgi:hypothetical protein
MECVVQHTLKVSKNLVGNVNTMLALESYNKKENDTLVNTWHFATHLNDTGVDPTY